MKKVTETGGPGRPKGSKNAVTLLREAVMTQSEDVILKHFPKIVQAVCKKAEEGDVKAAKLIMDRVLPARKAVEHMNQGGGGIKIVVQGIQPKVDIEDVDYEEAGLDGSQEDPAERIFDGGRGVEEAGEPGEDPEDDEAAS